MNICIHPEFAHLTLNADTAADLMTENPVSIHQNAYVKEAIALFVAKRISAAPVIDHAGRAVGVLSVSDIIVHDGETVDYLPVENAELTTADGEALGPGFLVEKVDTTRRATSCTAMNSAAPPRA
jgi:hypothetical protein